MKIVGFTGSHRVEGNTNALVKQVLAGAKEKGSETSIFNLTKLNIKGCQSCYYCRANEGCAIKDEMAPLYDEIKNADGIVIGSPVYMFQMTGTTKMFMDRLYPFINSDMTTRFSKKKELILVFTHASPDVNTYKAYFEHAAKAYELMGFKVKEIIVAGNTMQNEVKNQKELLEKVLISGQLLCN